MVGSSRAVSPGFSPEVFLYGVDSLSPSKTWAVGSKGSVGAWVLRWNGSMWRTVSNPSAPDNSLLRDVTHVPNTEITWAVGVGGSGLADPAPLLGRRQSSAQTASAAASSSSGALICWNGWWSVIISTSSVGSLRSAMPSASEKVGNCAIVSVEHRQRDLGADREHGAWWIHSPASGATAQAPRRTSAAVDDHAERAGRVLLVGVGARDGARQVDRRRRDVDAGLARLGLGHPDRRRPRGR